MLKRNLLLTLLVLCAIGLAVESGNAQATPPKWMEVSDKKLAFSLMLPSEFLIDNEEQKDFFLSPVQASLPDVKYIYAKPELYAYYKSLWIVVSVKSIGQTSNAKDHLWLFLDRDTSRAQDFKSGRFVGRRIARDSDELLGTYIVTAVSNRVITVSAWAKPEDRIIYEAFLRSITLDGQQLFGSAPDSTYGSYQKLSFGELATSTEIREALKRPDSRLDFTKSEPLSNFTTEAKSEGLSRPLIVLRQSQRPPYLRPEDKFVGTVKAKVRFLADGSIGGIQVFGDAPNLISRNIHGGLREIKFLPAQRDGQNVDYVRDFSFELRK